jgi:hypothetical protein
MIYIYICIYVRTDKNKCSCVLQCMYVDVVVFLMCAARRGGSCMHVRLRVCMYNGIPQYKSCIFTNFCAHYGTLCTCATNQKYIYIGTDKQICRREDKEYKYIRADAHA